MRDETLKKPSRPVVNILIRFVFCVIIILIGVSVMVKLAGLKTPPAETEVKERPIRVEAVKVASQDVTVVITGYGEVKSLNTVDIAPEVSGRIIHVHDDLEPGEVISRGDVLFEIDSRNYTAAVLEARAAVSQLESALQRLRKQYELDKDRQKTINRNRELGRKEFQRFRELYEQRKVGSLSNVDKAEQAYNSAIDQADQMARMIALYPLQIQEAQSSLASAKARLTLVEVNLERCTVIAPFEGRVKSVSLERGQYVLPGNSVVTLADDAILEIHVPIDSRDARKWLVFDSERAKNGSAWFNALKKVPCRVRWTEEPEGHAWEGRLHRIVQFNQQTRTLTVAVRIDAEAATRNKTDSLPVVEGMFCLVEIPGSMLTKVFELPGRAVSFEKTLYMVNADSRLKTVPVEVAHSEGDLVYVSEGLHDGDTVITTRLIDPLENALLDVTLKE